MTAQGTTGTDRDSQPHILLVEDDEAIGGLLRVCLEGAGFQVSTTGSGWEGLGRALTDPFDLVLLDVQLPGIDGFEICRRVRSARPDLPIIFLTARADEDDQIVGWKLGADDYVTKPFSPQVLVYRIRALLQRKRGVAQQSDKLRFGHLEIDPARCSVNVRGQSVSLTAKEYSLLLFLAQNPHQVFTRAQLYERVWGEPYLHDDNTVSVFIHRLRDKLEDDPSNPSLIITVRGLGYSFAGR